MMFFVVLLATFGGALVGSVLGIYVGGVIVSMRLAIKEAREEAVKAQEAPSPPPPPDLRTWPPTTGGKVQ